VPGWAANCVGSTKAGYENVTGSSRSARSCAPSRESTRCSLSPTHISKKGVITQAISGPFDIGRPKDCKPDAYSGFSRFNPKPLVTKKPAKKHKKHSSKKTATTKKK